MLFAYILETSGCLVVEYKMLEQTLEAITVSIELLPEATLCGYDTHSPFKPRALFK